jgi:hypothetical protein
VHATRESLTTLLVAGFLLSLSACTSNATAGAACKTDDDCEADPQCDGGACFCLGGVCTDQGRLCSTNQPCPAGQFCCGGSCSPTLCCNADADCQDGFCDNGTCRTGDRPACSDALPCTSGRCLGTVGQCVECIYDDDCEESESLVCSAEHQCVGQGGGCTPAGCAADGLVCAPEWGRCRACVSSLECGERVCDDGLCGPCSDTPSCGLGRVCDEGRCIMDPGTPCNTNADCGDQVCNPLADRCEPCKASIDCGVGRTCDNGSCIADDPECTADQQCAPPASICQAGLCEPGCTAGDCTGGQVCSLTTGRCQVISTGDLALGETCTSHASCETNVCWPLAEFDADGQVAAVHQRCGQACFRSIDCPDGFICFEPGDGGVCWDASFFAPAALDTPPGGTCSDNLLDTDCNTGYCNTTTSQCMEMCNRDADCDYLDDGLVCVMRWPIGTDTDNDGLLSREELDGFTELCHEPYGTLPTDSVCDAHDSCQNGYCVPTLDYTLDPRCGNGCCTPADCQPSKPVCKAIHVWDGILAPGDPYGFQKVCLWRQFQGTLEIGEPCTEDSECKSEICIAGASDQKRCTQTCCRPEDCADYDWAESCRPPFRGTHDVVDPAADDWAASLGRVVVTEIGLFRARSYTTFCVPR